MVFRSDDRCEAMSPSCSSKPSPRWTRSSPTESMSTRHSVEAATAGGSFRSSVQVRRSSPSIATRTPRTRHGRGRDARLRFHRAWFSELSSVLDAEGIAQVDGVLLDLGVSSAQIDDPSRGFSLRADGPLDMRMDPSRGASAAAWLATVSERELRGVIADYGEERFAQQIARALVAARSHEPITRTRQLASIVAQAVGARGRGDWSQDPATRTFQAIRIFINQELQELPLALDRIMPRLRVGARLVVISFHSLEDRIVKQFMRRHSEPFGGDSHAARLADRHARAPAAAASAGRARDTCVRAGDRREPALAKCNAARRRANGRCVDMMAGSTSCSWWSLSGARSSLVTSRHQARKLFVDLEREQARSRSLDVEFGQLQIEQSTWAMPARVEKVARDQLHMQLPDADAHRGHGRAQAMRPAKAPAPAAARVPRAGGVRRAAFAALAAARALAVSAARRQWRSCRRRAARATAATSRCPRIAAASSIAWANRWRSVRR